MKLRAPEPAVMSAAVEGSVLVWMAMAGAAVLVLVGASVRAVPEHQRLVVTRMGRIVRVVGPGLVTRLVGIERWRVVSLRPAHLTLGVSAATLDGVAVHLRVVALSHVTDPARSTIVADPMSATVAELESCVAREVAGTRLVDLLPARQRYNTNLPALATGATSAWGVDVSEVEVGAIEVVLSADLLHSLDDSSDPGRP